MDKIWEKQEFGKNYILVEYEEKEYSSYRTNMILNNNVKGLLACKKGIDSNNPVLMYDVTNRKTLKECVKITYEDIKLLFQSITSVINQAERYLLDEKYLLIDPQYIYTDFDLKEFYFLYIPCENIINKRQGAFDNPFYSLADFLIEKIDHKCEKSVDMAYQFYKMSKERNFSIRLFSEIVIKEDKIHREEQPKLNFIQTDNIKEQVTEKENHNTEEDRKVKWTGTVICSITAAVLAAAYIYLKNIWLYSTYLLLMAIVLGICVLILGIRNMINIIRRKREDEFEIEDKEVSVEEYWENNEETVFFDDKTRICEESSEDICLEWKEKGIDKRYRITQFPIVIGKMVNEVDCLIDDPSVSRLHLKLMKKQGKLSVIDLNSTNGTSINGQNLRPGEEVPVTLYSEIMLGQVIVRVV